MRLKHSKLTFLCILCLSFAFFAAPALAAGVTVEDETGLLEALGNGETEIVVSGDISLTAPLVLNYDLALTGTAETTSLRFDADTSVSGDYYSQEMIVVSGAEITMAGLTFGMENPSPENDAYFWSLISVTASGDLTLLSCDFDGQGESYVDISSEGQDREALNGVYVEDGTLAVSECEFHDLDMAGVLLSSGARNIQIAGNVFDEVSVGVMTLHKTAEDYNSPDSAIKRILVAENEFGDCGFGVVLLPNVQETIIGGNNFGFDIVEGEYTDYYYPEIAGTMVLPIGIADVPGLMRAIADFDSLMTKETLDEMDPQFQAIHELITTHLVFPDDDSQTSELALVGNDFLRSIIGTALVGCNDQIFVAGNYFENEICGTLETGFPGALLAKLLDFIIDYDVLSFSSATAIETQAGTSALQAAVVRHEFPDYDADVTYFENRYEGANEEDDTWVGAAVALNASATFDMLDETLPPQIAKTLSSARRRPGNLFLGNYCGILLANGPGSVTIRGAEFVDNEVAIADVGYQTLLNGVLQYFMMGVRNAQTENPMEELEDIFSDFEETSASDLLVEGCYFDLDQNEGIWILNDRVSAVIRQNMFYKFLGSPFFYDTGMGSDELGAQSLPFLDFGGSAAIRVGLSELDCVPARVSIAENDFRFDDLFLSLPGVSATEVAELEIPSSFVHFDLVDASRGTFDLHLNRFDDLEYIYGNPNAYAVVVLGEDEIDGTRNLWLQDLSGINPVIEEDTSQALTWQEAYQHVYGPLEVAPVLTDEVLDLDEDIPLISSSDDRLVYGGTTSGGIGFDLDIASGDEGSLVLKPVTEEEARSAFTDEELEDLSNTFFLPLDIRVVDDVQGLSWTFRFENVEGVTNENLVVMTTTRSGVKTWDKENAYVSDDGQWIVLKIGPDTDPSFSDFTGSVTVTASNAGGSSGSGGGCQVGFAPVSALLLLLPLIGLKRR